MAGKQLRPRIASRTAESVVDRACNAGGLVCQIFTPFFVGLRSVPVYDRRMTTFFTAPTGAHMALASLRRAGFSAQQLDQVLAMYDEPHRRYHDREHIGEMLDAALGLGVVLTPAQALALVFHDAVYVPGAARGSNEAMSAQLLRVYADGLPVDCIERAVAIVLDSARHVAHSVEAQIVLDLDLMRLAAPLPAFDRYSRAVLAEQRALIRLEDEDAAWRYFCRMRRPFFARLLEREAIFMHPLARKSFESAARENLRIAISAIGEDAASGEYRETPVREPDTRETA
jgi:predicted metal-dependent HD superfamily phosphohydrolase